MPRWLRPRKGEFLLRGWCFNEKRSIKSIRIKTRQGTQVARYGIERQDLLEAFNSQNERILYSGFEVPLKVPRGSTPFELQYQYEGGDWDTLICETLIRPRLKAFDQENSNLAKSLREMGQKTRHSIRERPRWDKAIHKNPSEKTTHFSRSTHLQHLRKTTGFDG